MRIVGACVRDHKIEYKENTTATTTKKSAKFQNSQVLNVPRALSVVVGGF